MAVGKSTKPAGKIQDKWNLATNGKGDMTYVTTSIKTAYANNMEEWSRFLLAEKKIDANSSYATTRYVLTQGIIANDAVMRAKYGARQVA